MDRGIVIGLTSFVATVAILAIPGVANSHGRGMDGEPMTRAALEARIAEHFAEVDANNDGAITREEAEARHAARRAEWQDRRFARLDADGNGEISVAERDAARTNRHERRGARHAMMAENSDMRGRLTEEEMAALHSERTRPAPETRAERHARWMERRNTAWTEADTDGNGSLSRAEYDAMTAAHREHMADAEGAEDRGRRHRRGMRHGNRFERMDADSDGRVTLAEASERALARFDRADADSDGTVTQEERRAAWQTRRAERRERRERRNDN